MFMQIDYAWAWLIQLGQSIANLFHRAPEAVEPWIARLSDDHRPLGPSDAVLPLPVAPIRAPVVHVGATEDWSPEEEIGGAELSPELRPEVDVLREFHDETCKVVTKLSQDIDALVAAAMTRLDEAIEEAMWQIEAVNA